MPFNDLLYFRSNPSQYYSSLARCFPVLRHLAWPKVLVLYLYYAWVLNVCLRAIPVFGNWLL